MTKEILHIETIEKELSTIIAGNGVSAELEQLLKIDSYSHVFVLTDDAILKCHAKLFEKFSGDNRTLHVISSGESQKTLKTVENIWSVLHESGCDRSSLLISVGGGVVSDLGGFCAATYMRGVAHVNVPTTLLSQVDASVGGKNGINYDGIKNLIGTFNQPVSVLIDPLLLRTLPKRDFVAGFAEIIKHGLICDKAYFDFASSKRPEEFIEEELEKLIIGSIKIKHQIISKDIGEKNVRKLVNFGHTIGHAYEAASRNAEQPLLHGEAISIGMVGESLIAERKGLLSNSEVMLIKNSLENAGLPVEISAKYESDLMSIIRSDKKNVRGDIRFTLLNGIGSALIDQSVTEAEIVSVLQLLHNKGKP